MTETFRLRKGVKYQGMAFAAIFLCIMAGYSSIFFLEDPAKHGFEGEHAVAVVGGMGLVVFGFMLLLSLYMWAAYYVERLSFDGTLITVRSIFQNRQFDLCELERLEWRISPLAGSVRFRVSGRNARLDFHGYEKSDRLRIIRYLRDFVPTELQEGWPLFCDKVALPLRDGKPSIVRHEPTAKLHTITRRRYDRLLVPSLFLAAALATVLWLWLNFWQFFLVLPLVVVGFWLLLRFSVPREGRDQVQLTSTSGGIGMIVGWGLLSITPLFMAGLQLLGIEREMACLIVFVPLCLALPPMFYWLYKGEKQRRRADEEAAKVAEAMWEQSEDEAGALPSEAIEAGR
jgi:hypothetical protein